MLIAFPVNTPVSGTGNRVSSSFNRRTTKRGRSRFRSHPKGWTSGVAGIMAGGLAKETEAKGVFACLASLTTAVKGLAEVGTGRVVAKTEAAAGRRDAKGGNMPKRQAILADASWGVFRPESTNTVTTTNAQAGRT